MASSRHRQRKRGKRRGTQGGTVKTTRRGRPQARGAAKQTSSERRQQRLDTPPTWRSAIMRSLGAAVLLAIGIYIVTKKPGFAVLFSVSAAVIYIPAFYYFDSFMFQRRQRQKAREREAQRD